MIPNYKEKITIIGVQTFEDFNWYLADEVNDYDWILDFKKLADFLKSDISLFDKIFRKKQNQLEEYDANKLAAKRNGFLVIDEHNISNYLSYLQNKIISVKDLRGLLIEAKTISQASSLLPSLYLDFRNQIILNDSDFTEYGNFLPNGWKSFNNFLSYKTLEQYVPLQYCYWIENSIDMFARIDWTKFEDYIEDK